MSMMCLSQGHTWRRSINRKASYITPSKSKILCRLHYFLGLEVLYKTDGVLISQRTFALELLKKYDCMSYSGLSSHLDPLVKLQAKVGVVLNDPTYYRKLVGKLNFLTNTKLDIAYGVQHLSQFMQDPREPHLKVAFQLLRCLRNDPTPGIFFSNHRDCTIQAYYDSDRATVTQYHHCKVEIYISQLMFY